MKNILLAILLIIWMLFTLFLICSIVGMIFLAPIPNNTDFYKPMSDDRRSTWMLIGINLLRKILEIK